MLALALACTGPGSPSQQASSAGPEKTSVKIGVGGRAQIVYIPLTLADQLGYFRDEGISVKIDDLKAGAEALKAMLSGSVGVVPGFYEGAIRAQTEGPLGEMFTTV